MERVSDFLAMDGYGGYVWPAYAVATIVLIALLTVSLRFLRQRQADLAALEEQGIEAPHRVAGATNEA